MFPMFNRPTPPATLGTPSTASSSRKLKKIELQGAFSTSPPSKMMRKMLDNDGLEAAADDVAADEEKEEEEEEEEETLLGSVTFVITPASRSPVSLSSTSTLRPISFLTSVSLSGSARRKNGRVVSFKTNSSDLTADEKEARDSDR